MPLINKGSIILRQNIQESLKDDIKLIQILLRKCKIPDFSKKIDVFSIRKTIENTLKLNEIVNNQVLLKSADKYKALLNKLPILNENCVPRGYNEEYDNLVNLLKNLPELLNKVAIKLASKLNVTLKVIYFPQIGYVFESRELDEFTLQLENSKKDLLNNFENIDSNVEITDSTKNSQKSFLSGTNKYIDLKNSKTFEIGETNIIQLYFKLKSKFYYKTTETFELDSKYGDTLIEIQKKEIEIFEDLEKIVSEYEFANLMDFIADVDAISSLIIYAEKNNCVKPLIIDLKESEKYKFNIFTDLIEVDIDRHSIINSNSPIASLFGQICILAQIGAWISCQQATIPIFDNIFFCSGGNINVISDSTFQAEMRCLGAFILHATPESLILLEHICESTNESEGLSLYFAIQESILHFNSISSTTLLKSPPKAFKELEKFFYYFIDDLKNEKVNNDTEKHLSRSFLNEVNQNNKQ